MFDPGGTLVAPGPATFQFLALNEDQVTTRLAQPGSPADPMEVFANAFNFRVHVDNNSSTTDLPQPSINGVGADPDCGFLTYKPAAAPPDEVLVRFHADHPNDQSVFRFEIKRGSNRLDSASTPPAGSTPSYVELATVAAPNGYTLLGGYYERSFARGSRRNVRKRRLRSILERLWQGDGRLVAARLRCLPPHRIRPRRGMKIS